MDKIESKILAFRNIGDIENVVDSIQSTHIDARNILEGPLIITKICLWARKVKKRYFYLIPISKKAFDLINWCGYLNSVMNK